MRRKKQINRLVTSIVASMVALGALSQVKGEQPQLVVGIVIDQLRSDYIELMQSKFGQGGFNRLMRDGAYFDNVNFKCPRVDAVAGTALLMTGAYPRVNGLPSAMTYNAEKRIPQHVLTDTRYMGNFTNETFSPMSLKVSTIGDEVKLDNNGLGGVYAVAPDAQVALILAGHAANSAFWISEATGNWATTTFYKDVPQCIQTHNYGHSLAAKLDTLSWKPLLPLSAYSLAPESSRYYSFRYTFPKTARDRYKLYKQSGMVNEEVTDVALDCMKSLNLGRRGQLDMLNIGLSAAPFGGVGKGDGRIELQDTYLRLDRQIDRVLTAIEKSVGLGKAVVFVASTGEFEGNRTVDPKFNIPTGEFRPDRAKSLLNMYLMAVYGNGNWVDGYYDQNFYLNRKLIKEKNIDLGQIRAKSSEFLRQMSGVTAAYTFEEILNNPVSEELQGLNRMMIPATAGDVVIEVNPGWDVVDVEGGQQPQVKHVRDNAVSVPMFVLAPGVKAQRITHEVDAATLAPTVSRLLRIRSPNAAGKSAMSLQ